MLESTVVKRFPVLDGDRLIADALQADVIATVNDAVNDNLDSFFATLAPNATTGVAVCLCADTAEMGYAVRIDWANRRLVYSHGGPTMGDPAAPTDPEELAACQVEAEAAAPTIATLVATFLVSSKTSTQIPFAESGLSDGAKLQVLTWLRAHGWNVGLYRPNTAKFQIVK